jgi:hypothetical protein
MRLIFENWRRFLLVEETFDDVLGRIEKPLSKFIKGRVWDAETKTLKMSKNEIRFKADKMADFLVKMIPDDLNDSERALSLQWLITRGLKDPPIAELAWSAGRWPSQQITDTLNAVVHSLEKYFQAKEFAEKKDIFDIRTFEDLVRQANVAQEKLKAHLEKKQYLDAEQGIEVFRDDDEWTIYAIHNKGAACEYGKNTEWCTAAPGLQYFEQYYRPDDPLFYFKEKALTKQTHDWRGRELPPGHGKFQFHYGSQQFMDHDDKRIGNVAVKKMTELLIDAGVPKKYFSVYAYYDSIEAGNLKDPSRLADMARTYSEYLLSPARPKVHWSNPHPHIKVAARAFVQAIANVNTPSQIAVSELKKFMGPNVHSGVKASINNLLVPRLTHFGKDNPGLREDLQAVMASYGIDDDEKLKIRSELARSSIYPKVLTSLLEARPEEHLPPHYIHRFRYYLFNNDSLPPEAIWERIGTLVKITDKSAAGTFLVRPFYIGDILIDETHRWGRAINVLEGWLKAGKAAWHGPGEWYQSNKMRVDEILAVGGLYPPVPRAELPDPPQPEQEQDSETNT